MILPTLPHWLHPHVLPTRSNVPVCKWGSGLTVTHTHTDLLHSDYIPSFTHSVSDCRRVRGRMEAVENSTEFSSSLDQKECQNDTTGNNPSSDVKEKEEKIQKSAQEEPEEKSCPREDGSPCEDDVLCDACIESPCKAKKSCLTCLVSYCEDHLRPHLEKERFQSHRLVEPLKDVEIRQCEIHHLPLELYCCVESCCVCQKCMSEQHHGHETLSITEAHQTVEVQQNKSSILLFFISKNKTFSV